MPILSRIGRRSPRVRLLVALMYALLIAGAAGMVYPFLLLLSGSTKSGVDMADASVVPRYLTDEGALYAKFVEGLFNESLDLLRITYDGTLTSFEELPPPRQTNEALVRAWLRFLDEEAPPPYTYGIGFVHAPVSRGVQPHHLRDFKRELAMATGDDIEALNSRLGTHFADWNAVLLVPGHALVRRGRPGGDPLDRAFADFKAKVPAAERHYYSVEGFYRAGYLMAQYARSLTAYNEAHGTAYPAWEDVRLTRRPPTGPAHGEAERRDWLAFVRSVLNLFWFKV